MVSLPYLLIQEIYLARHYLLPICFVTTWLIIFMALTNLWMMAKQTATYASRMHQIPCSRCQFFTGNYQIKCAVHPSKALSEAAIGCPDYLAMVSPYTFVPSPETQREPAEWVGGKADI